MDTAPSPVPQPIEPEHTEPELYVEPPRLTARDMAGVIAALLALAVIGFAGYIWLNPDLSWNNVFAGKHTATEQAGAPSVPKRGTETESQNSMPGMPGMPAAPATTEKTGTQETSATNAESGSQTPAAGGEATEDFTCAQCGMDASRSASHVIAHWADSGSGHFDSWDCTFKYAKDQAKTLSSAEVNRFGDDPASPQMLAAAKAWFLYDTKMKVTGSMPPYVAAYPDAAAAKAAQPEMGGEVLDFAGLKAKWE
jgi:hypothetical protein